MLCCAVCASERVSKHHHQCLYALGRSAAKVATISTAFAAPFVALSPTGGLPSNCPLSMRMHYASGRVAVCAVASLQPVHAHYSLHLPAQTGEFDMLCALAATHVVHTHTAYLMAMQELKTESERAREHTHERASKRASKRSFSAIGTIVILTHR